MSSFELHFRDGYLSYQLWDSPLVETWSRMTEWYYHNSEYKREELVQNFEELNFEDECNKLRELGQQMLDRHGHLLDPDFPNMIKHRVYNRDALNWLHEQYEKIRTEDVPFSLPEAFNDQIHMCERFHRPDKPMIWRTIQPRPRIRTRFIHKEWGASAPWKLRYRSSDRHWFKQPISGRLYMCYCEVGKPPYSAYRDRDTVKPVPWTQFGPAFYITLQNWGTGGHDYDEATRWLEAAHGPGVYWMGEPELGILTNHSVDEAYEMVKQDPAIREMRWNYDD